MAGRNFKPATFQLLVDDVLLKTYSITTTTGDSQHAFAYEESGSATSPVTGNTVKVTLKHQGVSGTTSLGYIDYMEVNAWRSLVFTGPQMMFRNPEASGGSIVYQYQLTGASNSLQVWNVTDSIQPVKVNGQLSGSVFSFKVNGSAKNEFVAFDGSSYLSPVLMGEVENQNLHGDLGYDYLMVVYMIPTSASRLSPLNRFTTSSPAEPSMSAPSATIADCFMAMRIRYVICCFSAMPRSTTRTEAAWRPLFLLTNKSALPISIPPMSPTTISASWTTTKGR
jgi:hypothetical protein